MCVCASPSYDHARWGRHFGADRQANYNEEQIIGIARELWTESFGRAKQSSNKPTVRKGIKLKLCDTRKGLKGKLTEVWGETRTL